METGHTGTFWGAGEPHGRGGAKPWETPETELEKGQCEKEPVQKHREGLGGTWEVVAPSHGQSAGRQEHLQREAKLGVDRAEGQ